MLADRHSAHTLSALGIAGVLISIAMGMFLDAHSTLMFIILIGAIHGVSWALFSSPNMTIIMNSVTGPATSMASALGAAARTLGMVIGMLIVGLLTSLIIGNEPVSQHPDGLVHVLVITSAILTAVTTVVLAMSIWSAARPKAVPAAFGRTGA
jgi:MFS family permease